MKLHYSQTYHNQEHRKSLFQYLMKLHYSQTTAFRYRQGYSFSTLWNYTTLKPCALFAGPYRVSVPYEITLLSNVLVIYSHNVWFQYLMKLHYSQTFPFRYGKGYLFQYLMKLHYSQTFTQQWDAVDKFQYLMKLHYSQTKNYPCYLVRAFQYLMKLHYSQTKERIQREICQFQYLMKLHYSQTQLLLSIQTPHVSVPYEITLLSNYKVLHYTKDGSFSTLWNYTTLKLINVQNVGINCFSTLWNYTTLKPQINCATTMHRVIT